MDDKFDPSEELQDKHEQTMSSFEDLCRMMDDFNIAAKETKAAAEPEAPAEKLPTIDELIDRAAGGEEAERTAEEKKAAQPAPVRKQTDPAKQSRTPKEDEARKPVRKTETQTDKKKPVLSDADREMMEREAILNRNRKRHGNEAQQLVLQSSQPSRKKSTKRPAAQQTKKTTKKTATNTTKPQTAPRKKRSKAMIARRRRRRLMRLGTVIVILLLILVFLISGIKAIVNRAGSRDIGSAAGSGIAVTEDSRQETKQDPKDLSASQQESEQYRAIKDDDTLPSYALQYPGMYSDALSVDNELSENKVCYLTFDDGPSDTNTPKILDILKKAKVKATFFVVTSEVNDKTAPILKRIVDEGHTLCIHANEHKYDKLYSSTQTYIDDFAAAYDKIYEVTGYRVQGFRFPGGSNGQVNNSGCYDAIIEEMTRRGFEYYDWNSYDHDSEGGSYSAEDMAGFAIHEIDISSRTDVCLLMHDTYGKEKTVEALPMIIKRLKEAGIEMLPITNSTRPVHFSVNGNTPPEYKETPAEDDTASSADGSTDSDTSESGENDD